MYEYNDFWYHIRYQGKLYIIANNYHITLKFTQLNYAFNRTTFDKND